MGAPQPGGRDDRAARSRRRRARAELEQRGIEFSGDTFDSGVCHMAFFADRDGNGLMLHHRYAPRARRGASAAGRAYTARVIDELVSRIEERFDDFRGRWSTRRSSATAAGPPRPGAPSGRSSRRRSSPASGAAPSTTPPGAEELLGELGDKRRAARTTSSRRGPAPPSSKSRSAPR